MSVGLDLPLAGGGIEAGVQPPYQGNCLGQKRNTRLRVKQLICGSVNGMRIRQLLLKPSYPGQGHTSPRRHSSWKLECRDCRTIPGQGLLLTAERDQGDVREKIAMGNAGGGKPGSHESKATLLSHAITIASLPSQPASAAEPQSGWPIKLARQTIE